MPCSAHMYVLVIGLSLYHALIILHFHELSKLHYWSGNLSCVYVIRSFVSNMLLDYNVL